MNSPPLGAHSRRLGWVCSELAHQSCCPRRTRSREKVTRVLTGEIPRGTLPVVPGREKAVAGLMSLAAAVAYLGIAALHGAIGVARNDDWTYLHSAYRFALDGVFTPGASSTMLVGQMGIAWPVVRVFGPEIAPLQVLVAVLGALGLWAAYLAIRRILPPSWSAFSVGCLALGPIFGSLESSFMTDIPAFTLQMLVLLTGLRAMRSREIAVGWFAASLLAGIAAFSVREYALAAPFAVIATAFLRTRPHRLRPGWKVVGLTFLWLAAVAALFLWRREIADALPVSFLGPSSSTLGRSARAYFTLALLVAPVVPLVSVSRLLAFLLASKKIATVLGLGLLATWATLVWSGVGGHGGPILGNYVTSAGSYPITLPGAAPDVIPVGVWAVLWLVSLASLLMLVFLALVRVRGGLRPSPSSEVARVRSPDSATTVMLIFCLTTIGGLSASSLLLNTPLYDRNLIPLIPFVVALALHVARDHGLVVRRKGVVAALSLGVFGSFGMGMVDASATFDGAKWELARSVEAQGYEAGSIDGGYEWYLFHQTGPVVMRPVTPGSSFWLSQFVERPVCVTSQFEGTTLDDHLGAGTTVVSRVNARSLLGVDYDLIAIAGPESCQPGE